MLKKSKKQHKCTFGINLVTLDLIKPKIECWVVKPPPHPPGTGGGSEKSKYMWVLYQKLLKKKEIELPLGICWEIGFCTEKCQKHVFEC